VNSYSGKWLLVTGFVEILASIGLSFIPGISIDTYSLSVLGVFVLVFAITIVSSVMYMNRLP
jgi:cell shape-determining protein MreD